MTATDREQSGGPYVEFLEEWAQFADSVVQRWAGFGKRSIRHPADREDFFGPYQDFWMTMASAVGDLTEMSYRWAQAVDGMAGFARGPGSEAHWFDDDEETDDDGDRNDAHQKAGAHKPGERKPRASGGTGATKVTAKTENGTPKHTRGKPRTGDK